MAHARGRCRGVCARGHYRASTWLCRVGTGDAWMRSVCSPYRRPPVIAVALPRILSMVYTVPCRQRGVGGEGTAWLAHAPAGHASFPCGTQLHSEPPCPLQWQRLRARPRAWPTGKETGPATKAWRVSWSYVTSRYRLLASAPGGGRQAEGGGGQGSSLAPPGRRRTWPEPHQATYASRRHPSVPRPVAGSLRPAPCHHPPHPPLAHPSGTPPPSAAPASF